MINFPGQTESNNKHLFYFKDPHNKKTSAKTVVVKSISLEKDTGITINLIVYSSL